MPIAYIKTSRLGSKHVNDRTPTPLDEATERLYEVLALSLDYLNGDELAIAADALVVKTWASIGQNSEHSDLAAIALDNLIEALDLYIKSKHE